MTLMQPNTTTKQRRNLVERVIEAVASGMSGGVGFLASSGILFVLFAVLWGAVGIGLVWSQGSIDTAWQSIRELPWLGQAAIWLLFLPVMVGLWIWETTWPLILRVVLVVGVAGWNLLIFLPRGLGRS